MREEGAAWQLSSGELRRPSQMSGLGLGSEEGSVRRLGYMGWAKWLSLERGVGWEEIAHVGRGGLLKLCCGGEEHVAFH